MQNNKCYCDTNLTYSQCCGKYLVGGEYAPSAVALMRSRYSAFASHHIDYLLATTALSKRHLHSKEAIREWAVSNSWQKLEILTFTDTTVAFKAYYKDELGNLQVHYEFSTFIYESGKWYYLDGTFAE